MRQTIPIQSSHIKVQPLLFLMPQAIPISSSHISIESLSFPPATSNTNLFISFFSYFHCTQKIQRTKSTILPTSNTDPYFFVIFIPRPRGRRNEGAAALPAWTTSPAMLLAAMGRCDGDGDVVDKSCRE
ncbi:hypothetical protein LR48_Vigan08g206000 [Vigna angularis]|uniref:Uncharacterized protein n=1 Tax=Phaseolus angularis TaxID=3914 RepID=A0A0L9V8B2_PHAAN|nr:hypothetical protein LR48_Vigan08g206000 [Vigna angularis]